MGEGHGKDDVSEQIEDEEQVLGLKDEEQVPPEQDGNVFPFFCVVGKGFLWIFTDFLTDF